jgi:VanZ family protein
MTTVRRPRVLAILCLLVLVGILLAGLLPFRAPRNGVAWLPSSDGVHLSGHAILWSVGSFPSRAPDSISCTIEIWLRPAFGDRSDNILAFAAPKEPTRLSVYQFESDFDAERTSKSPPGHAIIKAPGALSAAQSSFLTVTSASGRSAMYVNGAPSQTFPYDLGDACAGGLVVGTSPDYDESWSGEILGLAIYHRELPADRVLEHYKEWTALGQPARSDADDAVALYLFNERSGSFVHNSVPGGPGLEIPVRYKLTNQRFLEPFWQEYRPGWAYVQDLIVNVLGFMPLGFLFCAYFSAGRTLNKAALIATALGLAVSLTIEVSQAFIPTRNSGTTDLITNTLGTFLGARLYGWNFAKGLLQQLINDERYPWLS